MAIRTAERPFEPHEQVWPGLWAAHMRLFMIVTDMVEEWPEGDHSWVDVLAGFARDARGLDLVELQYLAAVLIQDAVLLNVDDHEADLLEAVAAGADPKVEPALEILEEERTDYVLALARLIPRVEDALEDALLEADG